MEVLFWKVSSGNEQAEIIIYDLSGQSVFSDSWGKWT